MQITRLFGASSNQYVPGCLLTRKSAGKPVDVAKLRMAQRKSAKQAELPANSGQHLAKRPKTSGVAPRSFSFGRAMQSRPSAEVRPTPDFQPVTSRQPVILGGSEDPRMPSGKSALQEQQLSKAAIVETHKKPSSVLKRKDHPPPHQHFSRQLEVPEAPGTGWKTQPGFGAPTAALGPSVAPEGLANAPSLFSRDLPPDSAPRKGVPGVTVKNARRTEGSPLQAAELKPAESQRNTGLPADVAAFLGKDYNGKQICKIRGIYTKLRIACDKHKQLYGI